MNPVSTCWPDHKLKTYPKVKPAAAAASCKSPDEVGIKTRNVISNRKDGYQKPETEQKNMYSIDARLEQADMRQRHTRVPMYVSRELV